MGNPVINVMGDREGAQRNRGGNEWHEGRWERRMCLI